MQTENLNKIVALFLVGSTGIVLLAILEWDLVAQIFGISTSGDQEIPATPGIAVGIVFFLLPVSALLGAIVDGLADVIIRPFIKRADKRLGVAKFFGRRHAYERYREWKEFYRIAVERSGNYKPLIENDAINSAGVGHMFLASNGETTGWITRHYATFVLAQDMAFLVALALLLVPFKLPDLRGDLTGLAVFLVVGLLSLYGLLSLAIERYLYSFQAAFRSGCFAIYADAPRSWQKPLAESGNNLRLD